LVPSCARDADCKRLAGEQFGRSKNNVSNDVQICTLVDKEKHVIHESQPINVSNDVQICTLVDKEKHVEHVPQPIIDTGKSLYCVIESTCKDCKSIEPENQYEIEVVKGQDDLLANLTTYEIVAENFSVSPKTVQRAAEFVTVLDEIKEKTNMRSKW